VGGAVVALMGVVLVARKVLVSVAAFIAAM